MYKLFNSLWKILNSVVLSSIFMIVLGLLTAIYIKAFMFGFDLVNTYL